MQVRTPYLCKIFIGLSQNTISLFTWNGFFESITSFLGILRRKKIRKNLADNISSADRLIENWYFSKNVKQKLRIKLIEMQKKTSP